MSESRLKKVSEFGQSIWYDNIQRKMIESGEFQKLIQEDDLRGVTSNPTIFDKAISQSDDYDQDIMNAIDQGLAVEDIYWSLVIKDIQNTTDIFKPVYEKTNKLDGYVSIEVSPLLARDTEGTITQAKELWKKVNRQNVMVKVPATKEGIPAIEALIKEGLNINVTLIFSIERYKEVMNAYISGLEARVKEGKDVSGIASVASFFVSRVDTAIDKALSSNESAKDLLGKSAIANSKLAYQAFLEDFNSSRFEEIRAKGGRVQRPLWASTSTKNPEYNDVMYVESLIGDNTVNTLPPATIDAFRDHGNSASTISNNIEEAQKTLDSLSDFGVSLQEVTQKLEEEGVDAFSQSFNQLLEHLDAKKKQLIS